MAKREIQAGDLVRLKSGGPTMTVERMDGPLAECVWIPAVPFGAVQQLASAAMVPVAHTRDKFAVVALERVKVVKAKT